MARLRELLNSFFGRVVSVVIVVGVVAGGYYAATAGRDNYAEISQYKALVLQALSKQLGPYTIEPITQIEFPEASVVLGLPDELSFQKFLLASTGENAGRRIGQVQGTFNCRTGHLRMEVSLKDGDSALIEGPIWDLIDNVPQPVPPAGDPDQLEAPSS